MGYRNDLYGAGEWDLKSSSALTYDAEKVSNFIEDLRYVNEKYNDKAGMLATEYDHYRDNQTFVGRAADASKYAIDSRQKGCLHEGVYNIEKAIYDKYCNLDDMFKAMVDPSPKARINTDVIENIKCDYRRQAETADIVGRVLENSSRYLEQEFGDLGQVTQINYNGVRAIYDEFNGNGGLLDKCVKRMEDYETEALTSVNNSNLDYMVSDLQGDITKAAGGLDNMKTYDPSMPKNSISLVVLGANASKVTKSLKTSQKTKGVSALKKVDDAKYIEAMKKQYGFTENEVKLIADAYAKFDKWIKEKEYNELVSYTNKEKIQIFFGYLSALNPGYSSSDPTFRKVNASSTQNAIYNLKEMGVDAENLQKALLRQHSICAEQKKRDFVHECAMYSLMPSSALSLAGKIIKNDDICDLIGFKGDVYSASMEEDDMQSDIAAVNIYNRMSKCQDGNIFNAMTKYYTEENDRTINPADEFLKNYGDGDADKGMTVIKQKLDKKTRGAKNLQGNKSDQDVEYTKKKFLEYLENERSK